MSEYITHDREGRSAGLVKKKFFTFAEPPDEMVLDSGARLGPITLAYETFGTLTEDKGQRHPGSPCPHRRFPCGRLLRRRRRQARLVGQHGRARQRDRYGPLFCHLLQCAGRLHGIHRPVFHQPENRQTLRPPFSGGHHRGHGAGAESPARSSGNREDSCP